jgi:hypothetical protein
MKILKLLPSRIGIEGSLSAHPLHTTYYIASVRTGPYTAVRPVKRKLPAVPWVYAVLRKRFGPCRCPSGLHPNLHREGQ